MVEQRYGIKEWAASGLAATINALARDEDCSPD